MRLCCACRIIIECDLLQMKELPRLRDQPDGRAAISLNGHVEAPTYQYTAGTKKIEEQVMKVLVALDQVTCAEEVMEFVTKHTWNEGTEFSLIHVVAPMALDMPMASFPDFLESMCQAAQEDGRHMLNKVANTIKNQLGCTVQTLVVVGHAKQVIVSQAKEWNADLIIVGSHGRHGFEKFFYGSVSEEISGAAPCSVLVLRLPDPFKEAQKEEDQSTIASPVSMNAC
jgi:nucleotide-binding universal stress UspA family protein